MCIFVVSLVIFIFICLFQKFYRLKSQHRCSKRSYGLSSSSGRVRPPQLPSAQDSTDEESDHLLVVSPVQYQGSDDDQDVAPLPDVVTRSESPVLVSSTYIASSNCRLTFTPCNECIGVGCDFDSNNEYSKAILTLKDQRGERLYDALISIFRISDKTKEKIDNNSCSTVVKCIDLLHNVYHCSDHRKEIIMKHHDVLTVLRKELENYDA